MPIIKSAKKQVRSSSRRRKTNLLHRKAVKTAVRATEEKPTPETFKTAQKAVDKAAKRGTIHPNKAARLKSRLSRRLKTA